MKFKLKNHFYSTFELKIGYSIQFTKNKGNIYNHLEKKYGNQRINPEPDQQYGCMWQLGSSMGLSSRLWVSRLQHLGHSIRRLLSEEDGEVLMNPWDTWSGSRRPAQSSRIISLSAQTSNLNVLKRQKKYYTAKGSLHLKINILNFS